MDKPCGTCKDTPYMDKVSVYLTASSKADSTTIREALVAALGFTKKQSDNVLRYASSRGECLIFDGKREDAIKLIEQLAPKGINCQARSRGLK